MFLEALVKTFDVAGGLFRMDGVNPGNVFDLSEWLPLDTPLGSLFAGIFGYQPAPSVSEVVAYLGFLLITLFFFFRPGTAQLARPAAARVGG